jgi:hypothetical protein
MRQEILRVMPFTLSHAAAALPFRRTRLVMSALVVGCFAPDTPYFLFLMSHGFHGHTLVGIFDFDLPVGFVELWLYHAFVRRPLLLILPDGIRRRLHTSVSSFSFWPPARLALVVLSLLIGIVTHLLWDSFTHEDTWPYRHWELLRLNVQLVTGDMPVYKLLEYGCSVLGVAVLAVWAWHWYRTTEPRASSASEPVNAAKKRVTLAVLAAIAVLGGFFRTFRIERLSLQTLQIRPIVHFSADALVTAIALFLLGLVVFGVIDRSRMAAMQRT